MRLLLLSHDKQITWSACCCVAASFSQESAGGSERVALIYSKLHHHPLCALSTLNWLILHTSTRDWIWIYMLFITARFIYTI